MSGILKRKFEEVDGSSSLCSSTQGSDEEASGSERGKKSSSINDGVNASAAASIPKRQMRSKRCVHFEKVTVYYFNRRQGFTSVPSQGGSTLGMGSHHCCVRQFSLGEFALEQNRVHRDMLRNHLMEEKLNTIKLKLTKNGTVDSEEADMLTVDDISDDDIDVDNMEVDEYFFLQPLPTRRRRALLRSSGGKKIDVEEKHELRAIRMSREDCGCDCSVYCDPETCACSVAGIKCQVDRLSFPCGCTKEGCGNSAGRIEFNPVRVRAHFLHTIMKQELEKSSDSAHYGYQGNSDTPVPAPHGLMYPLTDGVPEATLQRMEATEEMAELIKKEEDHEEEDDEEDNEDEDEEDSDSLSGDLSDSSSQSFSDSAEAEEEDDDVQEKRSDFEGWVSLPSTSHAEGVSISAALCFSDGVVVPENHTNGHAVFTSASTNYCQMQNSSMASATVARSKTAEPCDRAFPLRDSTVNCSVSKSLGTLDMSLEQYAIFCKGHQEESSCDHFPLNSSRSTVVPPCTSDQENDVQGNGVYSHGPRMDSRKKFQNYLNHNSEGHYISDGDCFISTQTDDVSNSLSVGSSLTEIEKIHLSLESIQKSCEFRVPGK